MNYEIAHPEIFSHAQDFYGIKEVRGEEHNPRILSFFEEIGFEWIQDDETAWCSAFINYLALRCGYERSRKLNARSWLDVGEVMKLPTVGDIVIFWRESIDSWKGHVGIYIRDDGENIWTLGGNQSNSVCIKPYSKDRLLGYRQLNKIK